jgi:hypothetical protein
MFDLVNLPEEEDFIRDALIGNVLKLAKVSIQISTQCFRMRKVHM